jgi:hypothetical protein
MNVGSVEGEAGPQEGMHQHDDEAERTEQLAILNRMVKEMKIKLAQVCVCVCECVCV